MRTRYMLSLMTLVCLTILTACGGSEPAPVSQQQSQPAPEAAAEAQPAPPAEMFVAGQLQEVDPDAMTLVLIDTRGAVQQFVFSTETRITGIPRAGELRNQEGRNATIRYIDRDNQKSAVQIHIEVGS
jgi:hypothetical protein